jgi:uncharacterized membrane protein (GlpM family)
VLPLLLKMATTAAVVVAASVTAERAGPRVGGIIMALPVSAGPAYVFLAMQAPASFVAETALFSFASNAATIAYLVAFRFVAPRHRTLVTLAAATAAWFATAALLGHVALGLGGAFLLNGIAFPLGWVLVAPATRRPKPAPRPLALSDLAARAMMTASLAW